MIIFGRSRKSYESEIAALKKEIENLKTPPEPGLPGLEELVEMAANLDSGQKALLREVLIENSEIVKVNAQSPAAIGLIKKGFLNPMAKAGFGDVNCELRYWRQLRERL